MTHRSEDQLPDEFLAVERRLRNERPSISPMGLDQIKLRAKVKASRMSSSARPRKGTPMRSRVLTLALSALLVGGTVGAGIAGSSGDNGANAAKSQYKPGLGCGDKNHIHTGPPGNPSKTPENSCKEGSAQNP
jgi:hypothetical protein